MTGVNFLSYRGHGDGDVKVLASAVLLVGEEVIPNLKNIENKETNEIKREILELLSRETKQPITGSSHLVFTRQISSDASGSLFRHWMNQQISPCSQKKEC